MQNAAVVAGASHLDVLSTLSSLFERHTASIQALMDKKFDTAQTQMDKKLDSALVAQAAGMSELLHKIVSVDGKVDQCHAKVDHCFATVETIHRECLQAVEVQADKAERLQHDFTGLLNRFADVLDRVSAVEKAVSCAGDIKRDLLKGWCPYGNDASPAEVQQHRLGNQPRHWPAGARKDECPWEKKCVKLCKHRETDTYKSTIDHAPSAEAPPGRLGRRSRLAAAAGHGSTQPSGSLRSQFLWFRSARAPSVLSLAAAKDPAPCAPMCRLAQTTPTVDNACNEVEYDSVFKTDEACGIQDTFRGLPDPLP